MSAAPEVDPGDDIASFLSIWFSVAPEGQYVEVRPLNKRPGQRPTRQSFCLTPIDARAAIEAATSNGDDVYIGALPRRIPSGKASAVGAHLWLWADIDYGTIGHASPAPFKDEHEAFDSICALNIAPTMIVDTGGGFHAWFALDAEPSVTDWREAIQRLCHALRGDTNAVDPPRILRVPGTLNMKTEPPRRSRIALLEPEVRHPISAFLNLPAVPVPEERAPSAPPYNPTAQSASPHLTDKPFDRANDEPVATVLQWLGVAMHLEAGRVYCACPVHGGKNTSQMLVGGEQNTAYCFGDCKQSFSPVDLVAAVHRVSPREAVNLLAKRFNFEGFESRDARKEEREAKRSARSEGAQVIQHPRANDPRPPPPPKPDPLSPNPAWRDTLDCKRDGTPKNTMGNLLILLRNHSAYAGKLEFDQMRLMPRFGGEIVKDTFPTQFRVTVEQELGFSPSPSNCRDAISLVAEEHSFHPVRRYLQSLVWDQTRRVDRVAPDILGAKEEIAAVMVRKWFVSAVARAMQPGCKVDTALILVGAQGALKSSFFKILAGEWFADTRMDISKTDSYLQLHAAWLYEWAELESVTSKKEAAELKGFVTSQVDTFRAPYGHGVLPHERTTVIVGTTNEPQFLTDRTGARRFWIIRVPDGYRVDIQALVSWRDQLWAEALALHISGSPHHLTDEESKVQADDAAQHEVEDAWVAPLTLWLASAEAIKEPVTMHRVLTRALSMEPGRQTRGVENRVGALLRSLGWEVHVVRVGGSNTRVWTRSVGHNVA